MVELAEAPSFWAQVGSGFLSAARVSGRTLASAYQAIDPDVRRHVAQMPLLGLTLLSPRRRPVTATPLEGQRPTIFVHGLGGHRGNFLPMQLWLRLSGRRGLYGVGLDSGVSLEVLGERLRAFIAEVITVNDLPPDAQVDLVAHSMGGLVSRVALEDPETARRVATLITLGSPHAGSFAARYFSTEHTLALRPGSPLLRRLSRQVPWTLPTRLVCFWSQADVFLLPAKTACVEGALNHELQAITHCGYLLRLSCWRLVDAALGPKPEAKALEKRPEEELLRA